MPIRKDIWRPLIVEASIGEVITAGSIAGFAHHWLPEQGYLRFLADPFGLRRDGLLHLFVETYDYRTRRGIIEALQYDDEHRLVARRPVLAEPWHLSYPFVFEAEGESWMLPEASRSGALTLYRAVDFPWRWEAAATIALDRVAIDATLLREDGRWWLFYAGAGDDGERTAALFAAWAERLTGPWHPHPANPVRRDIASSRPGGTPVRLAGHWMLPVQDCTDHYGAAVRPLWIDRLDPDRFEAHAGAAIRAPAAFTPFDQGLHTLSAVGDLTLVDVKRRLLSPRSLAVLALRPRRRS